MKSNISRNESSDSLDQNEKDFLEQPLHYANLCIYNEITRLHEKIDQIIERLDLLEKNQRTKLMDS